MIIVDAEMQTAFGTSRAISSLMDAFFLLELMQKY